MACADYHDLPAGRAYRRVIDYEGGLTEEHGGPVSTTAFSYHVSIACNHCLNPECMRVCPTGAMHKDGLGLVSVDTERCIGCGYCTMACPYHAPSIDPEAHQSSKCNGCAERVGQGLQPICVDACPLRALDFGPMRQHYVNHPDCTHAVPPLPSAEFTGPNLLIKASPAALRATQEAGLISNYDQLGITEVSHEESE